ncbi:SusC/RagA family TonB-linked outer membrane protein, partial [Bacteroides fragilis]|nr:SusC/RagA family TonB-linked outer membrane protein [Bacteroides fragilis]
LLKKHNLDALLGFETEDFTDSWVYTHGSQYPGYKNEIANAGETSSNSNRDKSRLTSFLGRVNYNFDNTYYAGVSYRRDGSSRLLRDNRWGILVNIRILEIYARIIFRVYKNVITDGKLRLSYGVNGTQPSTFL